MTDWQDGPHPNIARSSIIKPSDGPIGNKSHILIVLDVISSRFELKSALVVDSSHPGHLSRCTLSFKMDEDLSALVAEVERGMTIGDPFMALGLPTPTLSVLGRPTFACTSTEISKAFRLRSRRLHPDRSPNPAETARAFRDLARAHAQLTDPTERSRLVRELAQRHAVDGEPISHVNATHASKGRLAQLGSGGAREKGSLAANLHARRLAYQHALAEEGRAMAATIAAGRVARQAAVQRRRQGRALREQRERARDFADPDLPSSLPASSPSTMSPSTMTRTTPTTTRTRQYGPTRPPSFLIGSGAPNGEEARGDTPNGEEVREDTPNRQEARRDAPTAAVQGVLRSRGSTPG